ncbi:MAG: DUF4089 domain-containing protein [Cyanobacteria bacterium P01_H01_bin.58]
MMQNSTPGEGGRFHSQAYVEQTAALLGLEIPSEIRSSVVEHFDRIVAIAQPILDFELPDDLESAATFEP